MNDILEFFKFIFSKRNDRLFSDSLEETFEEADKPTYH